MGGGGGGGRGSFLWLLKRCEEAEGSSPGFFKFPPRKKFGTGGEFSLLQ